MVEPAVHAGLFEGTRSKVPTKVESLPDLLGGNVPDLLGAPVLVESVLPNVPDLPSVVCCALLLCRLLRAAASRITVRVLVG